MPTSPRLAVHCTDSRYLPQSEQLAARLHVLLHTGTDAPSNCDFSLEYGIDNKQGEQRLQLRDLQTSSYKPVAVDFIHGQIGHRRKFGGGRGQPLARAVGLAHGENPRIIDATGGLGQDALVMADLGGSVTIIERSPIIAELLLDGLQRARAHSGDCGFTERMQIICADSREYLRQLPPAERPAVVYLDPMYPHRDKSALVKKEMRVLRKLVGDDHDAADLLDQALQTATRRVVVKRPRMAPPLDGLAPGSDIASPNTRYDLYPILR
jgi:16S rRNA (guanine1516-N2)-methyltransferase